MISLSCLIKDLSVSSITSISEEKHRIDLAVRTDLGNLKKRVVTTEPYFCNGDFKAGTLLVTSHSKKGHNDKILWEQLEDKMTDILKQHPELAKLVKRCKKILNPHVSPNDIYESGVIKFTVTEDVDVFDETNSPISSEYTKQLLSTPHYVRLAFYPVCIWINKSVAGLYFKLIQIQLVNGPYPGTDIKLYDSDESYNLDYDQEQNDFDDEYSSSSSFELSPFPAAEVKATEIK